jgi:hypothetical protein
LATNVPGQNAPGVARAQEQSLVRVPTKTACRRGTGAKNEQGWSSYFSWSCFYGQAINVIFYVTPGSAYSVGETTWNTGLVTRTTGGGCPIVAKSSCQAYYWDNPTNDLSRAVKSHVYKSSPGSPVVGDKWCSG